MIAGSAVILSILLLALAIDWIWRSRKLRQMGGHRPPGSLGLVDSIRATRDYDFYRKQVARHGPIFVTRQYKWPVVAIVGQGRIRKVLGRHGAALRPAPLAIDRYTSGGLLRYMPPDVHVRYRGLVRASMSRSVVERCEPFVVEQSLRVFDEMSRRARIEGNRGVGLHPFLDTLVFAICARTFLGLEPDDERNQRLRQLYRILDYRRPWLRPQRTRRAFAELVALTRAQASRLDLSSAAPSCFLGEVLKRDPAQLDDSVLVENLAYFLHIARNDTVGLLGWVLKMLADHPHWSPQVADDRSTAEKFVMETLRLRQSEYLYRMTAEAIEVEGFVIPAGWLIRLCIRESHTESALFENPFDFDPERVSKGASREGPQVRVQPFGMDEHSCLGVHMAMSIAGTALRTFAQNYQMTVVSDGPKQSGFFHHRHWRPNDVFRFRMTDRREVLP